MKTPANYLPGSTALELRTHAAARAEHGWLPAGIDVPRALDLSHWLSRAARGHTWNGAATSRDHARMQLQRRRPH